MGVSGTRCDTIFFEVINTESLQDFTMKTYGEPIAKMIMPSGLKLPRAPVAGELFQLDIDMPQGDPLLPWFPKGSYIYNGQRWLMLNDTGKQRSALAIGAMSFEVETVTNPKDKPSKSQGFPIVDLYVTPTHPRATFSGQASLWVHHSKPAHIWLVLFRKDKIASIVVQYVQGGQPQSMSLTFYDIPNSAEDQMYSLRVYTDQVGMLSVNSCTKFGFDGMPETAIIVEQNS